MVRSRQKLCGSLCFASLLALVPKSAFADVDTKLAALRTEPVGYARVLGSALFGKGIRFNNPYRLSTELGSDAESLSLTSSYLDLGIAMSFGSPDGFQHGGAVHFTASLAGVPQSVVVPSYFAAYTVSPRLVLCGRLGPAVLLQPNLNIGGELGGMLGYFVTSKVALGGELVGDLFYGAGTRDRSVPMIPILSASLGILIQHEVLP